MKGTYHNNNIQEFLLDLLLQRVPNNVGTDVTNTKTNKQKLQYKK